MRIKMKIGTRILAGYGAALLVMGGVGIVSYRATGELVDADEWVAHTHQIKEALASTLASLIDAETGERGFLLAGEQRFLEPYNRALKATDTHLADIRVLTADNPAQQNRLTILQELAARRLGKRAQAIDHRRKGAHPAERTYLRDEGRPLP